MTGIVQHAAKLAGYGLPVFRLVRGTKNHYLDSDWADSGATTDPEEVFEKFAGRAHNIGVRATDFLILDVDNHGKIDGFEALKTLPELPETFIVRTWSGGLHIYFDACGVRYGQRDLAPGINVRATNGYVVGPGSIFNGQPYTIVKDIKPAPVPDWLKERLQRAPEKVASGTAAVCQLDTPAAIASASKYLAESAPIAIEKAGGDNTTYKVACAVIDKGISEATCLNLMLDFYNGRCSPEWSFEELETIVSNAARYRQEPIGSKNPADGFVPGELPKPEAFPPAFFASSAAKWIGKTPEPIPHLVEGLVPLGFVTLLVSAGGRGKSTLAQQLMTCVASGQDFLGRKVAKGKAAGLFCEDADNTLHMRQTKICKLLGVSFEEIAGSMWPESKVASPVTLWDEKRGATPQLKELEAACAKIPDLKFLVLDGTAFLFAASEIDRGQVTRFLAALTGMAQRLGVAIILIHHESKSSQDSDTHAASGSTAWINACRSVIKLNDDEGDLRTLKHIKCNLAKRQPDISCTMATGAFCVLDRGVECREATLSLMLEHIELGGGPLSPKPQAGNYAARVLSQPPKGKTAIEQRLPSGFTKEEHERALRDLVDAGKLTEVRVIKKGQPTFEFAAVAAVQNGGGCGGSRRLDLEPPEANKHGLFGECGGSISPD